jgi:hypothetical protein
VVAVSGDRLQRAHGAEALSVASRLIDGTTEATAIFDFPYPGSTGASCSSAELAIGNRYRGIGHVPGRSAFTAASCLAVLKLILIDGFAECSLEALRKIVVRRLFDQPHKPARLAQQPKEGFWQDRLRINSH